MKRHIPNILTIGRLVLTALMFLCLALLAQALKHPVSGSSLVVLAFSAFVAFVVAAVTDFFDGMLARRWNVVSMTGAILDPIADKVLVCGAILGLLGVGVNGVLIPGTLILFREFAVSALREVLAPKGIKLPVTFLAKTKTTLQLVALGAYLLMIALAAWPGGPGQGAMSTLQGTALVLIWLAAATTVWTGIEYAMAARKALTKAG